MRVKWRKKEALKVLCKCQKCGIIFTCTYKTLYQRSSWASGKLCVKCSRSHNAKASGGNISKTRNGKRKCRLCGRALPESLYFYCSSCFRDRIKPREYEAVRNSNTVPILPNREYKTEDHKIEECPFETGKLPASYYIGII